MFAHLRANLWLLFLSLVICCVLYPAAVWVVGQTIFHNQAQGSLVDENGNPVSDPAKARRLHADRPVVQQRLVLPVAALGRVVQRGGVRRLQLRGQQPEAARPRRPAAGADRPLQRGLQEDPRQVRRERTEPAGRHQGLVQGPDRRQARPVHRMGDEQLRRWRAALGDRRPRDQGLHPPVGEGPPRRDRADWKKDNADRHDRPRRGRPGGLLLQELRKGVFRQVADRRGGGRREDQDRRLGEGPSERRRRSGRRPTPTPRTSRRTTTS